MLTQTPTVKDFLHILSERIAELEDMLKRYETGSYKHRELQRLLFINKEVFLSIVTKEENVTIQ